MKEYFESYSNLAYSFIGLLGLLPYFSGFHGISFCMVMQALSAASFTYHWHKTKPIYLFDWWAMVYVITAIIGHVVGEYWCWVAVFAYQIIYAYFIMGRMHVFVEVGLVVVPCLIAILFERGLVDLFVVLGLLLLAIYIRSRDEDPTQAKFHDSWEHSVWHILTAPVFFIGWFGLDTIFEFFK